MKYLTLISCLVFVLLSGCTTPPNKQAIQLNDAGVQQHSQTAYTSAIASFDEALDIDPGIKEVHYNKGLSLYVIGDYEGALNSFDQALAIDSEYIEALSDK
jgi:tetratricopeptide (TPR) repeat protein